MSDSVDRVFVHALNTVKRIPRTGTARPPASERLKLYGLYKQSMEGDVEGVMDRPVGNTADVYAECEKWDAWYAQSGLSRTEAKRRYISTLIETMHRYASQTPEARELVAELEFVWDQIKSNTSSTSSGSSPLRPVGVPPVSQQTYPYASIGGRLARSSTADYEHMVAVAAGGGRGDSRLRVLSPVSQPDEMYQRHRSELGDDEAVDEELEEDEDEEYAEAQDTLYDDDEDHEDRSYEQERDAASAAAASDDDMSRGRRPHDPTRHPPPPSSSSHHPSDGDNRRWRRRVEQALTKMTAEVAAVREQMEARALAHRRRSSLWAWLKWLVWVTFRQIIWDLAVLGMLLIWMRVRGDRRLEEKLKVGWAEVKTRLAKLKGLRQVPKVYSFP
ncbi:acyl CoA binding protein [Aspergillus terreus]|uniref:Acyl CoA binding protein n=1 Tax=Aspergillus terreus TaxID=33178 RepID=A0A5M3YT68_ASPTE|nr:hypothetical protein ATETN484_0003037300 [Aspergillus terreus]GFF14362.1 acyl CoA binding protein [Aspergillus terreus]